MGCLAKQICIVRFKNKLKPMLPMDKKEMFDKIGIVVDKEFNECRNKRLTWKLQKDDKNKSTLIYSNSDVLIGIFSSIQNNEEAKKFCNFFKSYNSKRW